MAKRIGGSRRKTRNKLSRCRADRSKIKLGRYLQRFNVGDRVAFVLDSSCKKGLPNSDLHGKIGTIAGESGKNYIVEIKDKNAVKKINISPVHLRRA